MTLTRSNTTAATNGTTLTRSSSVSPGYQRAPYTTPAASRSSAFSPSTFAAGAGSATLGPTAVKSPGAKRPPRPTGARSYASSMSHSPSSYTLSSIATAAPPPGAFTGAQPVPANNSPPNAVRSRSSSAIASYR
ncbi:hypothetical protein COOONC_18931 [Cooperia oncophora]